MALEYWHSNAIFKNDGQIKCRCVMVWDTKLKKVVDEYIEEYTGSKEEYEAWRRQFGPVILYR